MYEVRRINRSSFPKLFLVHGVVTQIISASQDGLGSSEKHFRHDVHQLQRFWQGEHSFNLGCVAGKEC